MIENLKPDGEGFIDSTDCHYESKAAYLQLEILGFCGCGNPNQVMEYVLEMLLKLDRQEWGEYGDLAYMFFVYWANDEGFAEHGTTARCSWLTDKGKELVKDIQAVIQER